MIARPWLYVAVALAIIAPACAQEGPVAWWSFDDAEGNVARDASGNVQDAQVIGASWASGPFGTALHFDGEQSCVTAPAIPALDGSDALTVSAWVCWTDTGQYPNIITGGQWSPGGFMFFVSNDTCSFRMGRPGHAANTPGQEWRETGAPLVSAIETNRWYHLVATFERPTITTYVDGVRVSGATWDYPVGHSGPINIGCWYQDRVRHSGLIDDVRVWDRALSAEEVVALHAETSEGRVAQWEILPQREPEMIVLNSDGFTLKLDDNGRAVSLAAKPVGRELLGAPQVFAIADVAGEQRQPARCALDGDRLALTFSGGLEVLIGVEDRGSHMAFEVLAADDSIDTLTFLRLQPQGMAYTSPMSGAVNDGDVGVCIRALNLDTRCNVGGGPLTMSASGERQYRIVGARAGLVCCAMGEMLPSLRRLVDAEDVPQSDLGGPWAREAERNRGSYLFANVTEANVDDWIALAQRGGFTTVHFSSWWQNLGQYEPRATSFPGGMAGLKECVRKVHEAGLLAGMHTLTGCIDTNDPWVTPVPDQRLAADASYTLARAMDEQSDTIFVVEKPQRHDTIWSYSGGGNVMRIGEELVMYSGISYEEPYAFTGCTRGAFKTVVAAHPEGKRVDHLRQRYLAFYPDENSTLVDDLADNIARVYNECEFDQLYQDGSEGIGGWRPMAVIRTAIYERLNRPAIIEASAWGHWSWYFHSRVGAWDHAKWGFRTAQDLHVASLPYYREAALLEAQLGWWAVNGPGYAWRAEMPEEMEYFCAKVLAHDAPMSLQGIGVIGKPTNARMREYLTMTGWYESLRLAGYFDDGVLERLAVPGDDYHLQQAADGQWELLPRRYDAHVVSGLGDGSERWEARNAWANQPAGLRITALYDVAPYESEQAVVVASADDLSAFDQTAAATGVTPALEVSALRTPADEPALALSASSTRDDAHGAWARVGRSFEPHLSLGACDAIGVWVHGDGSGAMLNIQLANPPEYSLAYAFNLVRLDFEGWRYFELLLRERDPDMLAECAWPFALSGHPVLRSSLTRDHVSELMLYLNDVPADGSAEVAIGPIRALPTASDTLSGVELTVGTSTLALPVEISSGSYLEVDPDGAWRLYDARCELLERGELATPPPVLAAGANTVSVACTDETGAPGRVEVTLVTQGEPLRGMRSEAEIDWAALRHEFVQPALLTENLDGAHVADVICRPGAGATLGAEITLQSAGGGLAAYESDAALPIESFDDISFFGDSPDNQFAKYVHDGQHQGVSVKPGVTQEFEQSTEVVKVGEASARYSATSTLADRGGWSARGRRFAQSLDLTAYRGLGVWVHGDGKMQVLKFQLRDTAGGWCDMTRVIDFTGWRFLDLGFGDCNLDLSQVEYLIIYYNALPAGGSVTTYIDDIRALPRGEGLVNPSLTAGGATVTFPATLDTGDRVVWDGGATCTLRRAGGDAPAETVQVEGELPHLQPGVPPVSFSAERSADHARVEVALVKRYM